MLERGPQPSGERAVWLWALITFPITGTVVTPVVVEESPTKITKQTVPTLAVDPIPLACLSSPSLPVAAFSM